MRTERLAGFGRAFASTLADRLGDRLAGDAGKPYATMAGRDIVPTSPRQEFGASGGREPAPLTMTGRDLLPGSGFLVAGDTDRSRGRWSVWGQAGRMSRAGGEGLLGLAGIDHGRGRLNAGVALSHGGAEGGHAPDGSYGIEGSLSGVHPYVRLSLADRFTLWGALGHATGEVAIGEDAARRSGMVMSLAAAGAEGALLSEEETDSSRLSFKSDAYIARIASEGVMPEIVVSGLRLALGGAHRFDLDRAKSLTPSFEAGMRREGGPGAAATGVDLKAAMDYEATGLGVALRFASRVKEGWVVSLSAQHDAGTDGRLSLSHYWHVVGDGPGRTEYRFGLWLRMPLGGGATRPASGRRR